MRSWVQWTVALALSSPAVAAAQQGPVDKPTDKDAEKAVEEFLKEFNSPEVKEDDQVLAVRRLAATVHVKTLPPLAALLHRGASPVRIAAAMSLARFVDFVDAPKALVAAYAHPANQPAAMRAVRIRILQSLGALKSESAVGTVNCAILDKDAWIARAAVEAAGLIRSRSSIDALIARLKRLESREGDAKIPDDDPVPNPIAENQKWAPKDGKGMSGKYGEAGGAQKERDDQKTERQILRPVVDGSLVSITRVRHCSFETWSRWWSGVRRDFQVPK